MDYTILVNKKNLLPEDYVPNELVEIHEPTGSKLDKTYVNRLNTKACKAFKEMQKAALKEGLEIFVDSSYRSYEYQKMIFNDITAKKGIKMAEKLVAPAGGSEHQTGLAVDIIFRRSGKMLEGPSEKDPEIKWLIANAHNYGFILRYPKGKEAITGFDFEPWHFRYVGEKAAKEIFSCGITLEEYKLKEEKIKLVRIATIKDIELIKDFFYDIFPEETGYDLSHFKSSVNGTHRYMLLEYYIGYKNNIAVGISGVYANQKDECWLGWFGIRPKYRRNGYASSMLDLQMEIMKNYGFRICRLYTNEVINKEAVTLYLKKGFYKDSIYGKNIITMAKTLDNKVIIKKWQGRPLGFVPEWEI